MRIGTAGWSIPVAEAGSFPAEGASLERYSAVFTCAEINSSFHRSHRPSTYERWAVSVAEDFRFSAKLPKTITHKQRLAECDGLLNTFAEELRPLGDKLAILLVQLPPSLAFDQEVVARFLKDLQSRSDCRIACEPRHPSWFSPEADALLASLQAARVAADPVKAEGGDAPAGWRGLAYWRLHGSPVPYRSSYDQARLRSYAAAISEAREQADEVWCIFDNTASSAAVGNALELKTMLRTSGS